MHSAHSRRTLGGCVVSAHVIAERFVTSAILINIPIAVLAQPGPPPAHDATWHFAIGGDSRNCGDVIMPAIAEAVKGTGAKFYWHLGDWRAIYNFDEDTAQASVMAVSG